MRRPVFLFLTFLLLGNAPVFPADALKEAFQAIDREILTHFSAYDNLRKATEEIGHRMTATENGQKAEDMAFEYFRRYGFEDVTFEPFEISSWVRGSADLEIRDGEGTAGKIEARAFGYSAIKADVEASMVYLAGGSRDDFAKAGHSLKGSIGVVDLAVRTPDKNTSGFEKVSLLEKYGALGAVFISPRQADTFLAGSVSQDAEPIALPVLCITAKDGSVLVERIKKSPKPLTAHIRSINTSEKTTARNVIATIQGKEWPDERIVLGAHLDSWDLATGAMDNGTGAFTVLEIARAFKALGLAPRRTVQFVLFMGEEEGMVGSRVFTDHLKKDNRLKDLKYAINLDMNGDPLGFDVMGRTEMIPFVVQTGKWIREMDVNFQNKVKNGFGLNGDQESFLLHGAPVLMVNGDTDPNGVKFYHTDKDHFERVDRAALLNNCRFVAMMLYALADADAIPARTLSVEENGVFLEKQGAKEELVRRGRWFKK